MYLLGWFLSAFFKAGRAGRACSSDIEGDGGVEAGPLLGGFECFGELGKSLCLFGFETEESAGGGNANDRRRLIFEGLQAGRDSFLGFYTGVSNSGGGPVADGGVLVLEAF